MNQRGIQMAAKVTRNLQRANIPTDMTIDFTGRQPQIAQALRYRLAGVIAQQ